MKVINLLTFYLITVYTVFYSYIKSEGLVIFWKANFFQVAAKQRLKVAPKIGIVAPKIQH